jgi:hypothetical protein
MPLREDVITYSASPSHLLSFFNCPVKTSRVPHLLQLHRLSEEVLRHFLHDGASFYSRVAIRIPVVSHQKRLPCMAPMLCYILL